MDNVIIRDTLLRNPTILDELGERLYVKIKEVVIPEWTEAFNQLSQTRLKTRK